VTPPTSTPEFWSDYQPGFRFAHSPVGTKEFFDEVSAYRRALEPHIDGVVHFDQWGGLDVLEAGCGIGTDGARFAASGARYTGVDFSGTALSLATRRFQLHGLDGRFLKSSLTDLPFRDGSFDLVFSHGVIHHIRDVEAVVGEFRRILRVGGTALVMVYHRHSLNYHLTIQTLRRAAAGLLLVPGGPKVVAKVTGEPPDVLDGQRRLLTEHGLKYLTDSELFLSNNTDGPGNPYSRVYSRDELRSLFSSGWRDLSTEVRYLNLRLYPGGARLSTSRPGQRLERTMGWHLYLRARRG
jgi:SAM-dependent methyltransferase